MTKVENNAIITDSWAEYSRLKNLGHTVLWVGNGLFALSLNPENPLRQAVVIEEVRSE